MHTIFLDANSPYHVGIPSAEQWPELIDTAQTFVIYDQSLPPERQSPYTRHLVDMLNICVPLFDTYETSETQRTIASEAVKRLEEQAAQLTRRIHQIIKGAFYDTPEQAEAWGFQIKQSTRTILLPRTPKERLAMLKKYIAQEESRPPENRFPVPDLATVKQTRADLVAQRATRRSSRDRRKSSRAARDEAFAKLVDWLRMAAGHLMLDHFNHKVSFEMQQWGYIVIERPSGRNGRSEESSVEPAPPETTANGSGSASGGVETVGDGDDTP